MTETIILDPDEAATGRTKLDITPWIKAEGIDWGDAEVDAYMAEMEMGSRPVDFRLPNRDVTIPMVLQTRGTVSYDAIRAKLRHKVGLFQSERGWIGRTSSGGSNMYADVVNASLHLGGDRAAAFADYDVNAVLKLSLLPDFYGDEVTLDSLAGTAVISSVLKASGGTALIDGDYPARCRVIVTDTSGNDQKGLIWSFQSAHYDASATAALSYEAEALTPLNGAAGTALAGASGGTAVLAAALPASWTPILQTNIASGNQPLTHRGTYRVWARCYSSTGLPLYRLRWGVGGQEVNTVNEPTQLPGTGAEYLVDLGVAQLTPATVGTHRWFGLVEVYSTPTGDDAYIDALHLQPVDECAGQLVYTPTPNWSLASQELAATVSANDSSGGYVSWDVAPDEWYAYAGAHWAGIVWPSGSHDSQYLNSTDYGFTIPAGATITGIEMKMAAWTENLGYVRDRQIYLLKAGVRVGANLQGGDWADSWDERWYGGDTSLWGTTWTPADVNNAGFGSSVQLHGWGAGNSGIDWMILRVYYRVGAGVTIYQDRVMYANKPVEVRTDGAFRTPDGSGYAELSNATGDRPRLPPSLESRPVRVFVKPSRGNFDGEADAGLDGLAVQVKYRAAYLGKP